MTSKQQAALIGRINARLKQLDPDTPQRVVAGPVTFDLTDGVGGCYASDVDPIEMAELLGV